MKVDLFDFDLPADFIAQRPASPRDTARLLVVEQDAFLDQGVRDLPGRLTPGDILVFNDTRVIPARLKGKRGGTKVEVTLHRRDDAAARRTYWGTAWRAFARPARKLKAGDVIDFSRNFRATVTAKGVDGEVTLAFALGGTDFSEALKAHGAMPLPPYIKRKDAPDPSDTADYQTLFAEHDGAVAAPTAGLHFTNPLLEALSAAGVRWTTVTLHVGAGTFLPVKTEDTDDHPMHSEWGQIGAEAAIAVNSARACGGRVIPVGTTSLRLLESAAQDDGTLKPFTGETDIFITPGYRFKCADMLLTNFHLPRSTLFMLVSAFSGLDRMQESYAHAKEKGYRFYSYGDACLLHKRPII